VLHLVLSIYLNRIFSTLMEIKYNRVEFGYEMRAGEYCACPGERYPCGACYPLRHLAERQTGMCSCKMGCRGSCGRKDYGPTQMTSRSVRRAEYSRGHGSGKPCCKLRNCPAQGWISVPGQGHCCTKKKIDAALGLLKLLRLSRQDAYV
jgi:hypothetical protein